MPHSPLPVLHSPQRTGRDAPKNREISGGIPPSRAVVSHGLEPSRTHPPPISLPSSPGKPPSCCPLSPPATPPRHCPLANHARLVCSLQAYSRTRPSINATGLSLATGWLEKLLAGRGNQLASAAQPSGDGLALLGSLPVNCRPYQDPRWFMRQPVWTRSFCFPLVS